LTIIESMKDSLLGVYYTTNGEPMADLCSKGWDKKNHSLCAQLRVVKRKHDQNKLLNNYGTFYAIARNKIKFRVSKPTIERRYEERTKDRKIIHSRDSFNYHFVFLQAEFRYVRYLPSPLSHTKIRSERLLGSDARDRLSLSPSLPAKIIIGKAYSRQEINFEAFPQYGAVEMGILVLLGGLAIVAGGPILPRLTPSLSFCKRIDLVLNWDDREPHCGSYFLHTVIFLGILVLTFRYGYGLTVAHSGADTLPPPLGQSI
jgi:hypothetical protein